MEDTKDTQKQNDQYRGLVKFEPGKSGNPGGKPVAARNLLQGDFMRVLAEDFAEHGKRAVVMMREEKPAEYIRAIASLMPKELEITRTMDELDDDVLSAAIVAVRAIVAAQDVGAGTEDSEQSQQVAALQTVP